MARPFARARAMMAAIQAILSTVPNPFDAHMQIDGLAPYRSRGHGRGVHGGVRVKAYAKMRAQHNKSIQGKQEIARRLTRGLDGQCGVLHG